MASIAQGKAFYTGAKIVLNNKEISSRNVSSLFKVSLVKGVSAQVRRNFLVSCAATSDEASFPPTVSDTKDAFLKAYKRPIPSIYNNVIQELLVQHHLIRYNRSYRYDPILALGFVTVFDQLVDGYPYGEENADFIFKAYINALGEDPEKYRSDAKALEEWVQSLPSAEKLLAFAEGDGPVEQELQAVSAAAQNGSFHYSRFFAVGLFRLLELASAFEPATLEKLSAAIGVPKSSVERDLDVYRGLLNKLTQAKDLLKDFLERERTKQAEREKEKVNQA